MREQNFSSVNTVIPCQWAHLVALCIQHMLVQLMELSSTTILSLATTQNPMLYPGSERMEYTCLQWPSETILLATVLPWFDTFSHHLHLMLCHAPLHSSLIHWLTILIRILFRDGQEFAAQKDVWRLVLRTTGRFGSDFSQRRFWKWLFSSIDDKQFMQGYWITKWFASVSFLHYKVCTDAY